MDNGIDSLIRQRILFVEQRTEKDAVCAVVVHFCYFNDSGSRVQEWYCVFAKNAGDDSCFSQTAIASLLEKVKNFKILYDNHVEDYLLPSYYKLW